MEPGLFCDIYHICNFTENSRAIKRWFMHLLFKLVRETPFKCLSYPICLAPGKVEPESWILMLPFKSSLLFFLTSFLLTFFKSSLLLFFLTSLLLDFFLTIHHPSSICPFISLTPFHFSNCSSHLHIYSLALWQTPSWTNLNWQRSWFIFNSDALFLQSARSLFFFMNNLSIDRNKDYLKWT